MEPGEAQVPDVSVSVDAGDPGKLKFEVINLPEGPTVRPAFRLRAGTKRFATDSGFSAKAFQFEWASLRQGSLTVFTGPRSTFDWLTEGEQLTFEVPEVAYRGKLTWPIGIRQAPAAAPVRDQPRPILKKVLEAIEESPPPRLEQKAPLAPTSPNPHDVMPAQASDGSSVTTRTGCSETDTDQRQTQARPPAPVKPVTASTTKQRGAHTGTGWRQVSIWLPLIVSGLVFIAAALMFQKALLERRAIESAQAEGATQTADIESKLAEIQARTAENTAESNRLSAESARQISQRLYLDQRERQLQAREEQIARDTASLAEQRQQLAAAEPATMPAANSASQAASPFGPPPMGSGLTRLPGYAAADDGAECDRLAANPNDVDRSPNTGAPYQTLVANAANAIAACERARAANPQQPRFAYQLGRALQESDPEKARQLHQAAANAGYRAAFDNLAWIAIKYDRNHQEGDRLLREGISRGDPDAMVNRADLIIRRKVPGTPAEAAELYYRAANTGHRGAANTTNRVQGYNLNALASILLSEAR